MKSLVHASDILVDGFIAHTFSPQDTHNFLTLLFRKSDFLQHHGISYSKGAWYIMRNAPHMHPPSPGISTQNPSPPLDFSVRTTQGTIVPQRRWTPADEADVRRHVEGSALQLPIFFVNHKGGIGFWLPDILQGRHHDLHNGDTEAPLGGKTTTHIRINVSSHVLILVTKILIHVPRSLSQWPGYGHWKRQIPTRDETFERQPITLARFMKHIGTSVDKFFNVSFSLPPLSLSLIKSLLL
jgi:hypothetical protein